MHWERETHGRMQHKSRRFLAAGRYLWPVRTDVQFFKVSELARANRNMENFARADSALSRRTISSDPSPCITIGHISRDSRLIKG